MVTQVSLNSGAVASAGTLKLQTNGTTDAVHIDASQNVGVGTASPSAKLDVAGSVNVIGNTTLGDASTDIVTVSGSVGFGSAPSTNVGVSLASTRVLTGNSLQTAFTNNCTFDSTATNAVSYRSIGNSQAAAFTLSTFKGFEAVEPAKGAGSTITSLYGLYVNDLTTGTNNYGITSAVSSGTNKWNIYASGSANNYFAGNVGIGITSPSVLLDVAGDGTAIVRARNTNTTITTDTLIGGYEFYKTDGSGSGAGVVGGMRMRSSDGVGSSTYLAFSTSLGGTANDAERMRIDGSGNLGLGVTPSAWGSGYKAVEMGAVGNAIFSSGAGVLDIAQGAYNNAGWKYANSTYAANLYEAYRGAHTWYNATSGTAGTNITFTQAMTLDASGNQFIGLTSTPAGWGASARTTVKQASAAVSNGIVSYASANENAVFIGHDGTVAAIGSSFATTGSYTPLAFYTSGAEKMRIDTSGNVLVTGAGGLGYGTGSGGAVTQATSRTTGVTLNKTNGAITLVSAAGSTSWQSFTVTNSTVAATDVVHVSQKSGTDLYEIHVTAVAAGSFRISFKTTAGTTTEQPVFNFAVIKAVTA